MTADLFDRKRTAKQIVEEFVLTPEMRSWAAQEAPSVPVDTEVEAWRDRCREGGYKRGKGIPIADAEASFRTACRNAEAWGVYRTLTNLRVLHQQPERRRVIKRAPSE